MIEAQCTVRDILAPVNRSFDRYVCLTTFLIYLFRAHKHIDVTFNAR